MNRLNYNAERRQIFFVVAAAGNKANEQIAQKSVQQFLIRIANSYCELQNCEMLFFLFLAEESRR